MSGFDEARKRAHEWMDESVASGRAAPWAHSDIDEAVDRGAPCPFYMIEGQVRALDGAVMKVSWKMREMPDVDAIPALLRLFGRGCVGSSLSVVRCHDPREWFA